jgi:hypothetical protein
LYLNLFEIVCSAAKSKAKKRKKSNNPHDLGQIQLPPHHGKLPDLPAKEGNYTRTPSSGTFGSSEEGIYQVPMTPPQQVYDTRVSPYPATYQQQRTMQPMPGPSGYHVYDVGKRRMSDGSSEPQTATTSGGGPASVRRHPSMADPRHIYETTANFNRSFGKGNVRKDNEGDYGQTALMKRSAMATQQMAMQIAGGHPHQKIYDGVENLRY